MPIKAKAPCRHPGCHKTTTGKYCDDHQTDSKRYDRDRGTATQRGYTYRWSQYSREYRKQNPLCVVCKSNGKLVSVERGGHVDHIKAVSGPDDPLFWEPSNHQSLCQVCHSKKTAKEDGGFGR